MGCPAGKHASNAEGRGCCCHGATYPPRSMLSLMHQRSIMPTLNAQISGAAAVQSCRRHLPRPWRSVWIWGPGTWGWFQRLLAVTPPPFPLSPLPARFYSCPSPFSSSSKFCQHLFSMIGAHIHHRRRLSLALCPGSCRLLVWLGWTVSSVEGRGCFLIHLNCKGQHAHTHICTHMHTRAHTHSRQKMYITSCLDA